MYQSSEKVKIHGALLKQLLTWPMRTSFLSMSVTSDSTIFPRCIVDSDDDGNNAFLGIKDHVGAPPDDDGFRNILLTATMTEGDFRQLVALNVGLYGKILNLPVGVKRNADMVNSWILSGCTLWIRVAGGRDVPSIVTDGVFPELLSEFEPDVRGLYTQENSLRKAAPDGVLTEQDYMDW